MGVNPKMKKTIQNYIFIGLGATIIILLLSFHFLDTIYILLNDYNSLVYSINKRFNTTYSENEVFFFGDSYNNINLLVDMVLVIIIILISVMIFLKIYWYILEMKENEEK